MPKLVEHEKQYKSNKELLSTAVFDINNSNYYDWIVTIIFYCVVHIVEMELDKIKNYHSTNHLDRKMQILATKSLKPIAGIYLTLYIESQRARYKCENITKKDAEKAFRTLENIEKVVC